MIKFSWKKINNKLDWNAFSVLEYFHLIRGIQVPSYLNRKVSKEVSRIAAQPLETGPCFVIDIDTALREAQAPMELYTYIELASKRNVFDYQVRGITHLPLVFAEEYQIVWIERNPMMKIENNCIYFRYEQEKQSGY